MPVLFKNLSQHQADDLVTILSAAGIPCDMESTITGWAVRVKDADIPRAMETVEDYFDENRDASQKESGLPPKYPRTFSALWGIFLLIALYAAVAASGDRQTIIRDYGASARHIINGEYYRTMTALLLHGDISHLAGNIVGIAVFGTAVCSILGWGVGWLMILLTGIMGNLLNAYLYEAGHLSIGASTAVFGSIGLLSAHQFVTKFRIQRQQFKAWIYLGGGLALLGFLGSGKYTDIMAHFFGFSAGIILGILVTVFAGQNSGRVYQIMGLLIILLIFTVSWVSGPGVG